MMQKQIRHSARLGFLCALCAGGSLALAQAAPQGGAAPRPRVENTEENRGPARPANNNSAAQAAAAMQRTGGSLLKATLGAQPDPGQAKLAQVSFFAVPEQVPKTLKKHDLVTIIVREESQSTTSGKTDFQKNAELLAQVNQMVQLKLSKATILGLPVPTTPPGIDFTGKRTFNGTGEVDRNDSFVARITAEILDVKPNGTLVLQARKRIKNDEEEQQFVLTGTCRVEDINPDNTLLSTQLYDLELQKNSKGNVRQATQRGRLPKLLDFINPF